MNVNNESNLLDKTKQNEPTTTYDRNRIFTVSDENKLQDKRGKRTSMSCFQDTKNKTQALITIMNVKSVDEVIDKLIDNYVEVMSDEEVNEFKMMVKTLDKRSIKR